MTGRDLVSPEVRAVLNRAMSEDQLLQTITEAATFLGWRWHHVRRSDQALQMGHSGFPDLVLAKAGRVLFLELKRQDGTTTPDQDAWLLELLVAGDQLDVAVPPWTLRWPVDAFVVRPSQLDAVLELLKS